MPRKYTPEQRISVFWSYVNKDGSIPSHMPHLGKCWEWTGARHVFGYGVKSWCGRVEVTHRISWLLAHKNIPDGLYVLHKCDNPLCVNPQHLFLGTCHDNMLDKEKKGRGNQPKGEKAPGSKLKLNQVCEIRERFANGGVTQTQLGKEYGVTSGTISAIVRWEKWK